MMKRPLLFVIAIATAHACLAAESPEDEVDALLKPFANAYAALVYWHIPPNREDDALKTVHRCIVIDSGGQYLGGTTDITRVWPIGNASAAMKRDYTLVLKGTIGLSRARFPRGTLSPMLDAIARAPLATSHSDSAMLTGTSAGSSSSIGRSWAPRLAAITVPPKPIAPSVVNASSVIAVRASWSAVMGCLSVVDAGA